MVTDPNLFRIESAKDGSKTKVAVFGVIDEHADLSPLVELRGQVEINLKGVRRINSFGVRAWIDAIRKIPNDTALSFLECPPPVVDQMNMVVGFLGHGTMVSFYVPLTCEECDEQEDKLFEVAVCRDLGGKLPPVPCKRCKQAMIVDDLEEQYLMFVREGRS